MKKSILILFLAILLISSISAYTYPQTYPNYANPAITPYPISGMPQTPSTYNPSSTTSNNPTTAETPTQPQTPVTNTKPEVPTTPPAENPNKIIWSNKDGYVEKPDMNNKIVIPDAPPESLGVFKPVFPSFKKALDESIKGFAQQNDEAIKNNAQKFSDEYKKNPDSISTKIAFVKTLYTCKKSNYLEVVPIATDTLYPCPGDLIPLKKAATVGILPFKMVLDMLKAEKLAKAGKVAEEVIKISSKGEDVIKITSIVKKDKKLLDIARSLGSDNSKDVQHLIEVLKKGGNPGTRTHPIEGAEKILEARANNGARVYYRETSPNSIEILAYSTKDQKMQEEVIARLIKLYPK